MNELDFELILRNENAYEQFIDNLKFRVIDPNLHDFILWLIEKARNQNDN
jgi:hypothetical protein